MKTLKILYLLPFLAIAGCGAIDKLTQFNVSYDTDFTVSAGTLINLPFTVNTPDVTTNSEEVFESNKTAADRVEEVKLVESTITVKTPEGKNFNFLKSVEVKISAEGLPEKRVAYHYDHINDGATTLILAVDDVELKDYIKKDSFKLICSVVTDELLTENVIIGIHTKFFVDARILGI